MVSCQIDTTTHDREKFQEICLSFFNNCLNIYNSLDKEKRFDVFSDICQKLLQITIINQENLEQYFTNLMNEAKIMTTRTDQCNGYIILSQLYFTHFKDGNKENYVYMQKNGYNKIYGRVFERNISTNGWYTFCDIMFDMDYYDLLDVLLKLERLYY